MRLQLCAMGLVVAWAASASVATPTVIEDNNATLCVDPDSKHGVASWRVDGVNHLAKQWYWFRCEPMDCEASLSTLGLIGTQLTDTNTMIDPRNDTATSYYGDLDGFHVETRLAVQGGLAGSGACDVVEQIAFCNRSGDPLKLWFFQYADFDLGADAGDDTVQIRGGNTAVQWDAASSVSETVVTPMPLRVEAGYWCTTLASLCDGDITILNNDRGPRTGDVTWAFQWCLDIPAGGSVQISKTKHLVPEPSTMGLLTAGVLAMLRRRGIPCRS
jgi:hypothetical protein